MYLGMRAKLLVPSVVAIFVCMGLASYFSSTKAAVAISDELFTESGNIVRMVERSLANFEDSLQGAVVLDSGNEKIISLLTPEGSQEPARSQGIEFLKALSGFDPSIQAANILDSKGETIASSDPQSKGNFSDREYFKRAMAGEPNVSEPLLSRITGKPVIIVAAPIKRNGQVLGILYIRVDLGKFSQDMVDPVKIGQRGYAYIVDNTGYIVCHPDKSLLLKLNINDFDWGRNMLAMGSGRVEYTFKGEEKTAIFAKSARAGWTVAVTVNAKDVASVTGAVQASNMLFGGIGIILVTLVLYVTVRKLLGSLDECVAFAAAVAKGDLDQCLDLHRKDELGRLGSSLQSMVSRLKEMIEQARSKTCEAEELAAAARAAEAATQDAMERADDARKEGMVAAAQRLEKVVSVATEASQELTGDIRGCGDSAEHQSQRIGEVARAMEELNSAVLGVARSTSEAAETSATARKNAQEGSLMVGRVVANMGQVESQSRELKGDMDALGRQAEGIGRVLNVISDIADQTNLLALNAAIEAARAGDAGRGFAVVADEVRKLAEKTMAATREVGEAITDIQQGTEKNVRNMERSVAAIEEATLLASQSGQSLAQIVTLVEQASDQVRSIATAAEEQSATIEEITRNVEDANLMSQEVTANMSQAALAVQDLAEQTQELRNLVEQLKSDGQSGANSRTPLAKVNRLGS